MAIMELGRVCVVTAGRRTGQRVVVTKVLSHGFVQARATDAKAKERKYASRHLEVTSEKNPSG